MILDPAGVTINHHKSKINFKDTREREREASRTLGWVNTQRNSYHRASQHADLTESESDNLTWTPVADFFFFVVQGVGWDGGVGRKSFLLPVFSFLLLRGIKVCAIFL